MPKGVQIFPDTLITNNGKRGRSVIGQVLKQIYSKKDSPQFPLDKCVKLLYTPTMIIDHKPTRDQISYKLLKLVWKLIEVDQTTRYYGTDQPLFEAEIHMITAIKENEGIHVTGLAEKLGITKGAVSQIIKKIEKKGMVIKDKDIHNQSRLALRLTQKGETAYVHHGLMHQKFDAFIEETLKDASPENKTFLKEYLNSLIKQIDELDKDNL